MLSVCAPRRESHFRACFRGSFSGKLLAPDPFQPCGISKVLALGICRYTLSFIGVTTLEVGQVSTNHIAIICNSDFGHCEAHRRKGINNNNSYISLHSVFHTQYANNAWPATIVRYRFNAPYAQNAQSSNQSMPNVSLPTIPHTQPLST